MVMVDEPPALMDAGFNDAVAPAGNPAAVNVTVSGVPLTTEVEIVEVPLLPRSNVIVSGEALIAKSLAGGREAKS